MLKLISATPSPYARKVRIALLEKQIPFELITELPWNSTTQTPKYNPLEKLPVLIIPKPSTTSNGNTNGNTNGDSSSETPPIEDSVYESRYILEYIELTYPAHPLINRNNTKSYLLAKKIEVLADGVADALLLCFFEKQRASPSKEWEARQMRKVDGGLKALAAFVGEGDHFVVDGEFGIGDLAIGSVVGWMNIRFGEYGLKEKFPGLGRYCEMLEGRESFRSTRPSPQTISDKIV